MDPIGLVAKIKVGDPDKIIYELYDRESGRLLWGSDYAQLCKNGTAACVLVDLVGVEWVDRGTGPPLRSRQDKTVLTTTKRDRYKQLPADLWAFYHKLVKQGFSGDKAMDLTRDWLERKGEA